MRGPFGRCSTNYAAPAPNPDPSRWQLTWVKEYKGAYVLKVRYLDCTNFEGEKIMVFRGKFDIEMMGKPLDPHFTESPSSPVARFKPDGEGMKLALMLALWLSESP